MRWLKNPTCPQEAAHPTPWRWFVLALVGLPLLATLLGAAAALPEISTFAALDSPKTFPAGADPGEAVTDEGGPELEDEQPLWPCRWPMVRQAGGILVPIRRGGQALCPVLRPLPALPLRSFLPRKLAPPEDDLLSFLS
jgi:hypothetical protein